MGAVSSNGHVQEARGGQPGRTEKRAWEWVGWVSSGRSKAKHHPSPTFQLPVVQFEAAEWVGAIEEHMSLGVDRLQFLQGGLSAPETLKKSPQSS